MTTFCLIHGAWHDDACWRPLRTELQGRGHDCVTPVLPLEDPEATFSDYARVVAHSLKGREPAVAVGHSMSSSVIALLPAITQTRMLVYLCPLMFGFQPPRGGPRRWRPTYEPPPDDAAGRSWWPRDRAMRELYGRLDREAAGELADHLRPQPGKVFAEPYPLSRPPAVPSAFAYAREDELFDPGWSAWICGELLECEPMALPGGHFTMVEHPVHLADLLEQL